MIPNFDHLGPDMVNEMRELTVDIVEMLGITSWKYIDTRSR